MECVCVRACACACVCVCVRVCVCVCVCALVAIYLNVYFHSGKEVKPEAEEISRCKCQYCLEHHT